MFLLIDNYDSFTFNLVQAFMQLGRTPTVVRNDDAALPGMAERADLQMVCISPGPGHPRSAGLCAAFLDKLPHSVPVLGVCLGHQVLGHYVGARVDVGPNIMHGKQSLIRHAGRGLFAGLPDPLLVGRYHSLLVHAEDRPDLLEVTARTDEGEIMAMRFLDRPWAGVQFHPESVLTPDGLRLLANFPSALVADNGESTAIQADTAPAATASAARTPIQMPVIIETLAKGEDLSREAAAEAFARLMDGELTPSQAGGFLMGLRAKGETPEEVGEAVRAVLARSIPVPPVSGPCIDIVGTGGDGKFSFNCSTATSLTLAGMGHKVLKHGNRSVSSSCGSADVLEQLGISVDTAPEAVAQTLDDDGFVFLFAPRFHPAFKHVMPVRRELGVRTLFNILGPLVNPARPTHHFLGVPGPAQLDLVARTLAGTTDDIGAVVLGAGGYDELTTMGEASIMFVTGSEVRPATLDPKRYGFAPCREEDLTVEGPDQAGEVLRAILSGSGPQAMADMVALNLGLALYLLGTDRAGGEAIDACGYNHERMAACMDEAKAAVASGKGRRFVHA